MRSAQRVPMRITINAEQAATRVRLDQRSLRKDKELAKSTQFSTFDRPLISNPQTLQSLPSNMEQMLLLI
jgi:hypothetical protein